MKQKILFSALCLTLCASLLTGCWGKDDSSSSSMPPASSSSTVASSSGNLMEDASDDISDMLDGSGSMSGSASGSMSGSGSGSTSANSSSAAAPAAATPQGDEAWALRLVNGENPLPEDFAVKTKSIAGYENRQFDARAAHALQRMLADAEKDGNALYLVSSYRSVSRQKALFARKTNSFLKEGFPKREAERQASMWVARPGTSEHNLGLAADILSANWYAKNNDLTQEFAKTTQFAWLEKHAPEYGFVIRYPKDKEAITGVEYEPWHYRYVGVRAAKEMAQKGLTLEEYTQKGKAA